MYLENIIFKIISILSRGSHILECIFIVIKFYQYGTYKGLIWAKKPIWGPGRTQMGLMPRICPYGSHIYVFAGQSLPIWDLYRSYVGKKACMGPMQDPNGINVQILPIWVPYIYVCWVYVKVTLGPLQI